MTRRAARDIIALGVTGLALALFAYYMKAATQSAVDEAERKKPPAFAVMAKDSYKAGKEVWIEVGLANATAVERRLLAPVWPATLRFELEAARRKTHPTKAPPEIVALPPGGRLRRRIDLNRIFELPAGEYVLRARYEAAAEGFKGMKVWTGSVVSGPVKLKVVEPSGLPEEFVEMEE